MGTTITPGLDEASVSAVDAAAHAEFSDIAASRYAEILAGGKTVPWEEMRKYLIDRIAGVATERPRGR